MSYCQMPLRKFISEAALFLARPGIQDNQMLLDARFRGHDAGETTDFFRELLAQETRLHYSYGRLMIGVCV